MKDQSNEQDQDPAQDQTQDHKRHREIAVSPQASSGAKSSVLWAIFGNAFVMVSKLIAFLFTGSGSMLAESVHSLADVLNQSLLYLGVKRASRAPDTAQARGYGREQFVWSLISAVGIFFLGCGVTLYHGIHHLISPPAHSISPHEFKIGAAVLALSLLIEGAVFVVALNAARKQAGDTPLFRYLKQDADPALLAILLEDGAACLGVIFAAIGIGLTHLTGAQYWDSVGTLLIGTLLGAVAIWLVRINARLLVGRGLKPEDMAKISDRMSRHSYIENLDHAHSEAIGPGRFELQLELDFDEDVLVREVPIELEGIYAQIQSEEEFIAFCHRYGAEAMRLMHQTIDQLEADIREEVKGVDYIDIEPN